MPAPLPSNACRAAILAAFFAPGLIACQEKPPPPADPPAAASRTLEAQARVAAEDARLLEQLGYAAWGDDGGDLEQRGVVKHSAAAPQHGLNLYKSDPQHAAHLMDMQGVIRHTWTQPDPAARPWHHIELTEKGELLGIVKTECVEKLDWDSHVLWRAKVSAHHDLAIDGQGQILVLTETVHEIQRGAETFPIVDDGIATLSSAGEVLREVQLSSFFADRIRPEQVAEIRRFAAEKPDRVGRKAELLDVFHANTVEAIERELPGIAAPGDVLVCIRNLDLVAVLDLARNMVVWSWGEGVLDRPHQSSWLANGHLLVFDNGLRRGWSRVVELDPAAKEIVWEYHGDPPESFFSDNRGGCEELPGGDLLVVESEKGRALELTRAGEIVWEFLNPDVDLEKRQRAAIYRMVRISPSVAAKLPWDAPVHR